MIWNKKKTEETQTPVLETIEAPKLQMKEKFMTAERMSSRTMRELEIYKTLPMQYLYSEISLANPNYSHLNQHKLNIQKEIDETNVFISKMNVAREFKKKVDETLYSEHTDLMKNLIEEQVVVDQRIQNTINLDSGYQMLNLDYTDYIIDHFEEILNEVYDVPNDFDIAIVTDLEKVTYIMDFFLCRDKNIVK